MLASVTIEVHLAAGALVVGVGVAEVPAAGVVVGVAEPLVLGAAEVAGAELLAAAEVAGAEVVALLLAPAASNAPESTRPLLVGLGLTTGGALLVVVPADGDPLVVGAAEADVVGVAEPDVVGVAEPLVVGLAEPLVVGVADGVAAGVVDASATTWRNRSWAVLPISVPSWSLLAPGTSTSMLEPTRRHRRLSDAEAVDPVADDVDGLVALGLADRVALERHRLQHRAGAALEVEAELGGPAAACGDACVQQADHHEAGNEPPPGLRLPGCHGPSPCSRRGRRSTAGLVPDAVPGEVVLGGADGASGAWVACRTSIAVCQASDEDFAGSAGSGLASVTGVVVTAGFAVGGPVCVRVLRRRSGPAG